MELKEGYKQTDVGAIPADWEIIELSQVLEFKNGLNKAKEYFGSGTAIINYLDVFKSPHLDAANVRGLVRVDKSEQLRYGVRDGDVLFLLGHPKQLMKLAYQLLFTIHLQNVSSVASSCEDG